MEHTRSLAEMHACACLAWPALPVRGILQKSSRLCHGTLASCEAQDHRQTARHAPVLILQCMHPASSQAIREQPHRGELRGKSMKLPRAPDLRLQGPVDVQESETSAAVKKCQFHVVGKGGGLET